MTVELERLDNPILTPSALLESKWAGHGIFNPCVIADRGGRVHMLFRATSEEAETVWNDVYHKSTLGYAVSNNGGITFRPFTSPFIEPNKNKGVIGLEDARVVKFLDMALSGYQIFFTVVTKVPNGGAKVEIGGGHSDDFRGFVDRGIVKINKGWLAKIRRHDPFFCKGATYFPMQVNGHLAFLYTRKADSPDSTIMYAEAKNEKDLFAGKFHSEKLIKPSKGVIRGWEVGAPPLLIPGKGWL